jgi:hypothetical protein
MLTRTFPSVGRSSRDGFSVKRVTLSPSISRTPKELASLAGRRTAAIVIFAPVAM